MTDYRSLYDKDFIGAWDLQEGDRTITITRVVGGSLTAPGGRKSKKPVVYFLGSEKGFALNATNGKTIAAMYGNHVEKWVGKRITLYKGMTRDPSTGGECECIRVRPSVKEAPELNAAPQAPATSPAATAEPPAAEPAGAAPDRISVDQQTMLADMLREAGIKSADAYAAWRITKISELPAAWYKRAVQWISEQKEAA